MQAKNKNDRLLQHATTTGKPLSGAPFTRAIGGYDEAMVIIALLTKWRRISTKTMPGTVMITSTIMNYHDT